MFYSNQTNTISLYRTRILFFSARKFTDKWLQEEIHLISFDSSYSSGMVDFYFISFHSISFHSVSFFGFSRKWDLMICILLY